MLETVGGKEWDTKETIRSELEVWEGGDFLGAIGLSGGS